MTGLDWTATTYAQLGRLEQQLRVALALTTARRQRAHARESGVKEDRRVATCLKDAEVLARDLGLTI